MDEKVQAALATDRLNRPCSGLNRTGNSSQVTPPADILQAYIFS